MRRIFNFTLIAVTVLITTPVVFISVLIAATLDIRKMTIRLMEAEEEKHNNRLRRDRNDD